MRHIVAALVLLTTSLVAPGSPSLARQGSTDVPQRRNLDLRPADHSLLELPVDELLPAGALSRWRARHPGLRVEIDPVTGATRSVVSPAGRLDPTPRAGDAESIARAFVTENLDLLGLSREDVADMELTDRSTSRANGVTHLYFRQRHRGLAVYNGQLQVHVDRSGRIVSLNSQFVPRLAAALRGESPEIDARAAIVAAAAELGLDVGEMRVASPPAGDAAETRLEAPGLARRTIDARLRILPIRPGEARLVWSFDFEPLAGDHWWDVTIDAATGALWTRFDWVADADDYKVYPLPVESPNHTSPAPPSDGRSTETAPADPTASPYGWHDTDGVAGAESTLTMGNNVTACVDNAGAPNQCDAGSLPDGGASLVFTPAIDLTMNPSAYPAAAVVNLFYWNNVIHDVTYLYGFDEAAGNFQENNYGNGGAGSDSVNADAQDGSGTNNANFATPADGSNPRMQMYVFTATSPFRDGDLDAGIVAHEYGHGISNRLVGGPANVSCLGNTQQAGEGLSDWWSLFLTFDSASPQRLRGVGTYALGQPTTGMGIRTDYYDGDPATNDEPFENSWTYESINGMAVPHGVGSVWAQIYWEATWALIDAHGFDPDVHGVTFTGADAGNLRAMAYIIEGLKLTACSPTFTDIRDGVLAAAATLYGGEDVCLLWEAFARVGLGVDAVSGGSSSLSPTDGFAIPDSCVFIRAGEDTKICAGDTLHRDVLVGGAYGSPPVTLSASGNPGGTSTSFDVNPVPGPLPDTVELTIDNTGGASPGDYPIQVGGDDGVDNESDTFLLTVSVALPGTGPTLLDPLPSTNASSLSPTLQWSAVAGAIEYLVEVATDAGFGSIVDSATVAGTTHTVAVALTPGTSYFWRVTPENACGSGTPSAAAFSTPYGLSWCREPALAIPDDGGSTTTAIDTLVIPAGPTITDLDLLVELTHTWVGDVRLELSNGSITVAAFDRPGVPTSTWGCSGNNVDARLDDEALSPVETQCAAGTPTIDGAFQPNEALSAFDGEPIADSWTLEGSDWAAPDSGSIARWCLEIPDGMPFLDGFESGDTTRWSAVSPPP